MPSIPLIICNIDFLICVILPLGALCLVNMPNLPSICFYNARLLPIFGDLVLSTFGGGLSFVLIPSLMLLLPHWWVILLVVPRRRFAWFLCMLFSGDCGANEIASFLMTLFPLSIVL